MKYGKKICKQLKAVRKAIADANGIDYVPRKCNHRGDCAGSCPACEAEVRFLEREIRLRQMAGKAAVVAGLSLGVATLTGCIKPQVTGITENPVMQLAGDVAKPTGEENTDSTKESSPKEISPKASSTKNNAEKPKP